MAIGDAWADAIDSADDEAFRAARDRAEADGWNVFGWVRTIGSSGYGAPLWPKEYGGLSGEPWMQMIIREELGRYRRPTFGVNILGVGLAGPTIVAHGTEKQSEPEVDRGIPWKDIKRS